MSEKLQKSNLKNVTENEKDSVDWKNKHANCMLCDAVHKTIFMFLPLCLYILLKNSLKLIPHRLTFPKFIIIHHLVIVNYAGLVSLTPHKYANPLSRYKYAYFNEKTALVQHATALKFIPLFNKFCWPCLSIYACNETNLMHDLSLVYWVTILQHVSGLLVAHHKETAIYCIYKDK
jgi:hypothetical protein